MTEQMRRTLERGAAELGLVFGRGAWSVLEIFLDEVELWNPKLGLVEASGERLVVRHVLDSLAPWKRIASLTEGYRDGLPAEGRVSIGDVGAGAGFPGIPLALALPDTELVLIERSGRRAGFLRNVIALSGLENIRLLEADIAGIGEQFPMLVLRAFKPLEPGTVRTLQSALSPGGCFVAYKGRLDRVTREKEAVEELLSAVELLPVNVPYLNEERHLFIGFC